MGVGPPANWVRSNGAWGWDPTRTERRPTTDDYNVAMSPTSDDLMDLARAGADRLDLEGETRQFPSFADIEDQCEREYGELIDLLHEDELFEAVSLERQEELVKAITEAAGPDAAELVDELVDNLVRHTWLHQEAAFHLGMAVGLHIAQGRRQ